jgi:hypothetical protein
VTDRYRWARGEELAFRFGINHKIQILMFEPLFEEKNRTRRLIAQMARSLDTAQIGVIVPDLPGTGESLVEIAEVSFSDWKDAARAAVAQFKPTIIASMRGGALLDSAAPTNKLWRFAPENGARIVRDLERTRLGSQSSDLLGGHKISPSFLAALREASIPSDCDVRTVRLATDVGLADATVAGAALWRRAEPGDDVPLTLALTADIADWARLCAG